ncbi:MAG: lipoprotein [Moraxella sp.]|nr:lipoprotein [Moraxella sp.]
MKSLIIVALVVCGGICACGQKGELYLPDSTATVDVSEYERQDSQGNQEQNY